VPTFAPEDFWRHADRAGACWTWTGGTRKGYPVYRGRPATRIAYELAYGQPVPAGHHVRRRCAGRTCLNPEHLTMEATERIKRPIHKLSELQAEDVRARHAGGETVAQLAERYGVTVQHVRGILRQRCWTGRPRGPQPGSVMIVGTEMDNDGIQLDILACGHRIASTPWPNKWRRCKECGLP
jgi:hypothetical protein